MTAGNPTPPPFNDREWKNEDIPAPKVAHPHFDQEAVERSRREAAARRAKDLASRTNRIAEEFSKIGAEIQTEIEHARESQHLDTVPQGMPAVEMRTMSEIRADIQDRHPAGRQLEAWRLRAELESRAEKTFQVDLIELINKHSIDAKANIPDWILAHFIVNMIHNISGMTYSNRKWSEK